MADGQSDEEITDALDVTFTATNAYQRWLGAGLLGALLLMVGWCCALWLSRGTRHAAAAADPDPAAPVSRPADGPGLATRVLLGGSVLAVSAGLAGLPGVVVATATAGLVLGVPVVTSRLTGTAATSLPVRIAERLAGPVAAAMLLGTAGTVLMLRGPWGSGDYAGYSWSTQLLFLGCLVAVACSPLRRRSAVSERPHADV